ncbi:MAG: PQQ-binding-like beta-propeller repeat protein, partial [Planctomycetota bacterium]
MSRTSHAQGGPINCFVALIAFCRIACLLSVSVIATAITVLMLGSAANAETPDTAFWSQWRGPSQNGVARQSQIIASQLSSLSDPVWSTSIPGSGGSTPVVAGNHAYLTTGLDGANTLMCVQLDNGEPKWSVKLGKDTGKKHRKGSGSNPSAVTDGRFVAAYFRSGDLACVDAGTGEVVWKTNLQSSFGEDTLWWDLGASPALIDQMVVVAVQQTGPSYLVAYDLATGDVKWKVDRMLGAPEEAAQSYTTPLGIDVNGESMIAVMGADHLTIHRAIDGSEVGRLGGFNPDQEKYFRSISSPVAGMLSDSRTVVLCPYARGASLTAVDVQKLIAGDDADSILWALDSTGSDVPTPAIIEDTVVIVSDGKRNKGTVLGLSLESGETKWEVKLPRSRSSYSASPLIIGDAVVVVGEDA